MRNLTILISFVLVFITYSCKKINTVLPAEGVQTVPDFGSYWYKGEAEISSYALTETRYGEERKGNAVLIFVTEDFSREKQVKLDLPESAPEADVLKVLKLNRTKDFITGIYPYHIMTSVFTPVYLAKEGNSVKAVSSVQEWCGQTYLQLNQRDGNIKIEGHSYFESEGEVSYDTENAIMEDEVWSWLRLNPDALPTGTFKMLPSLVASRLQHFELRPQSVEGAFSSDTDSTRTYQITYPGLGRSLAISFQKKFPFKIIGWKERYTQNGKSFENTATLKATLKTAYWQKNDNTDTHLRELLKLE